MKVTTVRASVFRENWARMVRNARDFGDRFIITRRGKAVAAVIGIDDYRKLEKEG